MKVNREHRKRYALLIGLTSFVAAGTAIFFAVGAARLAAWQTSRANSLKMVGMALRSFDLTYKRLPMAVHRNTTGKSLSSWRFRILPYVEGIMQDWDYEKPWDDPVNVWLTKQPYSAYCLSRNTRKPESLHTNVVAIVGPGTVFDEDRECSLEDIDSDTVLAIEVANSGIPWAAPGDLSISDVTPSVLQGLDGDGLHVLFADGTVWYISKATDFDDLKTFFSIEGAKHADREQVLRPEAILSGNRP